MFLPMRPLDMKVLGAANHSCCCPTAHIIYAYWKENSGKLKKKYIGTKYDEFMRNKVGISLESH